MIWLCSTFPCSSLSMCFTFEPHQRDPCTSTIPCLCLHFPSSWRHPLSQSKSYSHLSDARTFSTKPLLNHPVDTTSCFFSIPIALCLCLWLALLFFRLLRMQCFLELSLIFGGKSVILPSLYVLGSIELSTFLTWSSWLQLWGHGKVKYLVKLYVYICMYMLYNCVTCWEEGLQLSADAQRDV